MSPLFYKILSSVLFIAHLVGFIWVVWGGWYLLKGVKGQGQSVEGIRALRQALVDLFMPIIWGALALSSLLILTLWEQSPLTVFIQGIAPLSTMTWVIWSHFSARQVDPGEMFEALVPLAPPRIGRGSVPDHFHQSAQAWSNQPHSLNARALTQTALRAVDDNRHYYPDRKPLSFDDLTMILRDALADTKEACERFPLGQKLTLADWFYEGERLTEIWTRGLRHIDRGRAMINPLTLIDNKRLWSWSKGSPQHLFEHELSAWLHHGLYLLVIRRISEVQNQTLSHPSFPIQYHAKAGTTETTEIPKLWQMMTRKITVPFWLYWGLCTAAISINHHLIGVILSVISGGLLWVSLNQATSIKRWRHRFTLLGGLQRPHRISDEELTHKVHQLVDRQSEQLKAGIDEYPLVSLLQFSQETSIGIATIYRRPEHPEAPLALLNATIVDALYTLELICDDLILWRNSGGIIPKLVGFLSKLGIEDQQVEKMLLDVARDWADHAEKEGSELKLQHKDAKESDDEPQNLAVTPSLFERAEKADAWLNREVDELNFVFKAAAILALSQVKNRLQDWISDELTARILPLYQGAVGQNNSRTLPERASHIISESEEVSDHQA